MRKPQIILAGLLGGAALVAGGVVLGRSLARRARERAWRRAPGRSPRNPVRVRCFDEIDAAVDAARCWCGGRLRLRAEAGRQGPAGAVRVARAECRACGVVHFLFFDLSEVRH
ncbi:MAG: hypothetical protein D6729_12215 [Deltaproteobacteria bacterium]|nr:MAG: hypothetical protein D6729_12215 [Deltaproteobacteria bacterium]